MLHQHNRVLFVIRTILKNHRMNIIKGFVGMGKLRDRLDHPQIIQGINLWHTILKKISCFVSIPLFLGDLPYLRFLGVFNSVFAGCEFFQHG